MALTTSFPQAVHSAITTTRFTFISYRAFLVYILFSMDYDNVIRPCLAQNNQPPTLILSIPLMGKDVMVASERTEVGSFLGVLEVEDTDTGPAGEVSCSVNNAYVGLEQMTAKFYKVKLFKYLDREVLSRFDVTIVCTDNGTPPLTEEKDFPIIVSDENDNAPIFDKEVYTFSVRENADAEVFVGNVRAGDNDLDENGRVEYSLVDQEGKITEEFTINHTTGDIHTNQVLDREKSSEFILLAFGVDHGTPPLRGEAEIRIKIDDMNDNKPKILTEKMSIAEKLPAMYSVGNIKATDNDAGVNAEIEYNMLMGEDGTSIPPFIVKSDGEVLAAVPLDRELRDEYVIEVSASDSGNPPLSVTASITITVDDVNDNPPVFTSPAENDLFGNNDNVSESVSVDWHGPEDGRAVFVVSAVDKDIGPNAVIGYDIDSINAEVYEEDDSLFRIGRDDGVISLRRFVERDDESSYLLVILARDQGYPPLTGTATINVTLEVDFETLTTPAPTDPPTSTIRDPRDPGNSATSITTNSSFVSYFILGLGYCWMSILFSRCCCCT